MEPATTVISCLAKFCMRMAPPHSTNERATIENDPDLWVGLEQEYFLYKARAASRLPRKRLP